MATQLLPTRFPINEGNHPDNVPGLFCFGNLSDTLKHEIKAPLRRTPLLPKSSKITNVASPTA